MNYTTGGRVAGKIAIVSGGGAGIGRATALRLAEEGAQVCLGDIDETAAEACVEEIRTGGGAARSFVHDVAEEADWRRVIDATVAQFGGLDILVNNAGFAFAAGVEETTTEQWRRIMAVNVDSVFFGCKFAIPAMRESGGGAIVNMSSILGLVGSPVQPAYNATKGAVRLFTKGVALECAEAGWNIRVNSVHPAYINTPMVARYAVTFGSLEKGLAALGKLHPVGRVGEAEEVANAVLYLASDEAKFVTGTELVIDGGYTAA
ncbi:MAG: glucose 1-dehydrogenase [Alphaproteobacteria bacterium]|jgi:NAD(P)-dependent dehydrogenase (short-subunit alcohol dehydrogenase family)|nr:glucose 1-dehydrogenase [Alphaproteobacteria bacterium]MDP6590207.1 glucose 1-dehydrogenase [Alphaproteobacteria bacterium]MDP6818679.1 glucose 1-dehydrogenase [Alphaproteobacteria bacterium]